MRTADLPEVRQLSLFSDMDEANFAELMQGSFLQRFPPQVDLIHEGDPADFLYIVIEGGVELFGTWNGRETTLEFVYPVATFILAAVLRDAEYLMSARTLEKSRLLMVPAELIRSMMDRDPAFARSIVHELSCRYRAVVKSLKDNKLRSSIERLANFLLRESRHQDRHDGLLLQVDKKTLAQRLGMTPENLSRAFGTLQEYGVTVDGRDITFSDIKALTILAKPVAHIDDPDC
ncbi:cyclic nucleotide-binding domain-containing protein [Ferrovibrio xuzhouensis]|uniref:Cyclic nucleotide-binding domain-containing protein n=1 Tax=Ferrovibrio xuzhouensis TaxID=1576914 RepID=A0ABV7VFE8_9PROT